MSGTPIYEEHGCPLCEARSKLVASAGLNGQKPDGQRVCADCGNVIPTEATQYVYKNMGGRGFQSHTSDHRHTKSLRGVVGFGDIKRELCLECYRLDFAKAYPGEPLPV